MLCVNAANIEKDLAWVQRARGRQAPEVVERERRIPRLLALQGPAQRGGTRPAHGRRRASRAEAASASRPVMRVADAEVLGVAHGLHRGGRLRALLRERGDAVAIFEASARSRAQRWGLAPAGLGARDTLRLEAALPPLRPRARRCDARPWMPGLGRFVDLDGRDFVGAEAPAPATSRRRSEARAAGGLRRWTAQRRRAGGLSRSPSMGRS